MISKNPVLVFRARYLALGTICHRIRFVANFALKFAVFVTMATGSVYANYDCHLLAGQPPKPGNGCTYMGYISYVRRVLTNFMFKFAIFRYHGNRGRSEQFLTIKFKQADPYNSLLRASIRVTVIYLTLGELRPILC